MIKIFNYDVFFFVCEVVEEGSFKDFKIIILKDVLVMCEFEFLGG